MSKMKKRIFKILKIVALVIIVLLQFMGNVLKVNAANIDEQKSLERGDKGYYCVQKWDGNKWIYLTYNQTFYTDINGKKYVAYCLSPGLPGVGYVSGEKETYQVSIKEILNDNRVWRIIKNGYPYNSVEQLGLETSDDAYFATMQAVNCVLRGYTLEQTKSLYSPGQFAINGENLQDIQRRGNKTLNVMFKLIDIGLNGSEKREGLSEITIDSETDFVKDNNGFYSKMFKVRSVGKLLKYEVNDLKNFPEGTFIADINGNKKTIFQEGENFKVMIPSHKIVSDINGKIGLKLQIENYPIFYASSMINGYQDYALCSETYSEVYANTEMYVYSNKSKLIINKVDSETKKPIENVKFQVINSSGDVNVYSTGKDGKIVIANQYKGEIRLKEIETAEGYRLDNKEIIVNLEFDQSKEINVSNELKRGNIKIIKVDSKNEKIKLENVKFQVINKNNKVVREGVTNKKGEVLFENLLVDNYKIKEVETQEKYELLNKEIFINVEDMKTNEIIIKNNLKTGNLKIIKVDSIDNNIKLEGAKFRVFDNNNKCVAEGTTNSEGELLINDLLIGKYNIVEVSACEGYILNNEKIEIEIEYNTTKEINIKNDKIIEKKEEKVEVVHNEKLPKTGSNIVFILKGLFLGIIGILSYVFIIKKR